MPAYIEPFSGSAALALCLMGAPAPYAPIGYAGNKRAVAAKLARLIWPYSEMPDRIVLADVGPWRTVWEVFARGEGAGIVETIEAWPAIPDRDLWDLLVSQPIPSAPEAFAAVYLFLQSRQAHHAPLWVSNGHRFHVASGTCGTFSRPGHTHGTDPRWERSAPSGETAASPTARVLGWGEALSRHSLLRRIERLLTLPWSRVEVRSDYCLALTDVQSGDVVYADPPYRDASVTYAAGYPDALEYHLLHAQVRGARVAVSEGRDLPLLIQHGWADLDVTPLFGSRRKAGSERLFLSSPPDLTVAQLAGGIQTVMF